MECGKSSMLRFLSAQDTSFSIPVYQRKYDWRQDHCRRLFSDLKKMIDSSQPCEHFFGTFVVQVVQCGVRREYYVIDGQQRLTTVSLLLLALKNILDRGEMPSSDPSLSMRIDSYLRDQISKDQIKLQPTEKDNEAYTRLFGDEKDHVRSSKLTINYEFFREIVLQESISPDDLFRALTQLQTVVLTLELTDNPQLIFESLNSTGLALTAGDKIRNFILMSLPPEIQTSYYKDYWAKIEKCVAEMTEKNLFDYDVSNFIRDYLSLKCNNTPTEEMVYSAFRNYVESNISDLEAFLKELLSYARCYERLLAGNLGTNSKSEIPINNSLSRLKQIESKTVRPFLVEVLFLYERSEITAEDLTQILLIIESYLFRRRICGAETNALNKVFPNLNADIVRVDGTRNNYVAKMCHILKAKADSQRFPTDKEFTDKLETYDVYGMKGSYRKYIFDRFENYDTKETQDVFWHLTNNVYTIEHIMPKTLTPEWRDKLGKDATTIHSEWLNRLANLTLTAYNSNLGNMTFREKRDTPKVGYRNSRIRMNAWIASKETWGLHELRERNDELKAQALKIWFYPATDSSLVKTKQDHDVCALDDDQITLTGKKIIGFSYGNSVFKVNNWAQVLEEIVRICHRKDRSILFDLVQTDGNRGLSQFVSASEEGLRSPFVVDEGIVFEKHSNTETKRKIMLRLFELYKLIPGDLIFHLKPKNKTSSKQKNNAPNTLF